MVKYYKRSNILELLTDFRSFVLSLGVISFPIIISYLIGAPINVPIIIDVSFLGKEQKICEDCWRQLKEKMDGRDKTGIISH